MAARDFVVSQLSRDKHKTQYNSTMSLPRSLHDAHKLYLSNTNHPAVNMFSCSLKAHRSCNEAIIFLYGVSGAGKSTTLNHLFDAELIPTSATESSTDSVIEWVSSMHSEHWRVSNLEAGFIDVPGWGDSEGRDATNFALMQQFLSVHPILGCKVRKFYPNIVLIVFNSNDNRMLGTEASAMKMLQTLSKLDIVDKKRPNVVIVLTHVCSHSPSEFSHTLSKQNEIYQSIARSTLGVIPPVVWLENDPSYELRREGDWTLLHDGTAQPLNLYEAMIELMVSAGDELGKEAIRLYFQNKHGYPPPVQKLVINATLCEKKTLSSKESNWIEKMKIQLPNYKTTPLNMLILDHIDLHPNLCVEPNQFNGLLVALASHLPDKSAIKCRTMSYLESTVESYLMSVQDKELLTQVLDLEVPKFPDCVMAIGRGYDMINGSVTDGQLFEISQLDSFCSFLNRTLSNSFSILPYEGNHIIFGTYNAHNIDNLTKLQHYKSQLIGTPSSQPKGFSDSIEIMLMDFEKRSNSLVNEGKMYFWIEAGIFSVQLNFPHVTLSKGFCDSIVSLPDNPFNEYGKVIREYTDFIHQYGHNVVVKANGGGIIEGDIDMTYYSEEDLMDKVQPCLETLLDLIKDGIDWRDANVMAQLPEDQTRTLRELGSTCIQWLGGDQKFTSKTIQEMCPDLYLNWLKSLKQSSLLFDYSFNLIPIHMLVASKYPKTAQFLKQAIDSLLPVTETNPFYDESTFNFEAIANEIFTPSILPSPVEEHSANLIPRTLRRWKSREDPKTQQAERKHTLNKQLPHQRPCTRTSVADRDKSDINKVGKACFSSDSKVVLKNGECINISEVSIGDSILSLDSRTNLPVYSQVYMWAHRDQETAASFVEIHHEQGRLKLSDNHLLLQGHERRLTTASRIQIGDCVHFFQSVAGAASSYCLIASKVTRVSRCVQKGVYCPFTENSRIVVDGLVCSVFAVPDSSVYQFARFEKISRFAMSPFILANRIGCRDRIELSCKMHPYLQMLLECYSHLPKVRECITK